MIEETKVKKIMENIEVLSKELGYPITKSDYQIDFLDCPHEWQNALLFQLTQ